MVCLPSNRQGSEAFCHAEEVNLKGYVSISTVSLGIDKAMGTIKVTSCHKKFGVGMNSQDKARNSLCDTWVEIYVDIYTLSICPRHCMPNTKSKAQ